MPVNSAHDIAQAWINHFWSADHELKWVAAEVEHSVWLTPNTLLAGRIDALGENDNGLFFGEWKTANPREKNTWKQVWRMNPQSLTYGVLSADWFKQRGQTCTQFTVRKAFKSTPPTFDHAWYSYNEAELEHWKGQLVRIADQIRGGGPGPWETNWTRCFQFGVNYACPHFEAGCSKMVFDIDPAGAKRQPHLEIERRLNDIKLSGLNYEKGLAINLPERYSVGPDLVVLDATRVKEWLGCREKFRREYVHNVATPMTEALQLGIDCHDEWGNYYQTLVEKP